MSHLEIEFTHINDEFIEARMPVNKKKVQPMGYLHGGASVALAESVAGAGSMMLIDQDLYNAYGIQISSNHIASIRSGDVIARGRLIHKGNAMHIWDVDITDEQGKLISTSRISNVIRKKNSE